jgi:hypothetical protein
MFWPVTVDQFVNVVLSSELKLCFFAGCQSAFSYIRSEECVDVLGPVWAGVLVTIANDIFCYSRNLPPKCGH